MNTRQIEYILEIAKEKNITRAAQKLFVTQSALNQQLLKLEEELGTKLFYRSRTDWHPTKAGEIYLKGAQEIISIKKNTYSHIAEITESGLTDLKIGLTSGRGIIMFTQIYPELHRWYPNLNFLPLEMSSFQVVKALKNNEIDIGFILNLDERQKNINYIDVGRDEMTVIIPRTHLLTRKLSAPGQPLNMIDLRELENDYFILMNKDSSIRTISDRIFSDAGFTPKIMLETSNTVSIADMVGINLCCGLIPRYYIDPESKDYGCFVLPGHPCRTLDIVYRKDSYLTVAAKSFIQLTKDYWEEHLPPVQTN